MNQDVTQQLVKMVKKLQDRVGYLEKLERATLLTDLGGAPTIGTLNYTGAVLPNINDDGVYSFTPGNAIGVLLIYGRNSTYKQIVGMISYRVLATHYTQIIVGYANLAAATGALTGTTGTDGNVTVSANSADGKIYIENRHGVTISLSAVLFGS